MSSQCNPQLANVFLKNLDKAIDNMAIYDTFSAFGNILSCKVATDEMGNSKGYGFVEFETVAAANTSIDKVNGILLNGKKISVSKFIPRKEREKNELFTNVYIKNFTDDFDEEKLKELFEPFGKITSYKVMSKDDGKNKGFGFVAYETPEAAESAVKALNGKDMGEGKLLYVDRAQKKDERKEELKCKYQEIEKKESVTGVNLYVKNLHDSIDDQKLKELFEPYGKITSYKIMYKDDGKSKGFGFVAYETPEAAESAVQALNGKDMGEGKTLYVARAQKKAERKQELKCKYREIDKKESVTGVNLYVKNLHDSIDDQKLNELFEPYGKITSCKVVVKNDGKSKGYGFVAYETTEAADAAIQALNGEDIGNNKILRVSLRKEKAQRRQDLKDLVLF